jgi:hypothetical protein
MKRRRAGFWLTAAATISVVVAISLLAAECVSFCAGYIHVDRPPIEVRSISLAFRTGLVEGNIRVRPDPFAVFNGPTPSQCSHFWYRADWLAPEIRSEFHANFSANDPEFTKDRELVFPAWVALLLCSIAPPLWWRKHRLIQRQGFEVSLNDRR